MGNVKGNRETLWKKPFTFPEILNYGKRAGATKSGGGAGESVIGPSLVRSGQVLIEISKYSNA